MNAKELWSLPSAELTRLLVNGRTPERDALAGHDFRGVSLGLPAFVERLTWKTFRKTFRRRADGEVEGCNVRLEQRGVDAAPTPKRGRDGAPITFGPFSVVDVTNAPFRCEAGVVLDYGSRHPPWHPLARVRDVVVALDDDLLLGALYLECGRLRVETPSFFTLERERRA
jgi:hypothetical protein